MIDDLFLPYVLPAVAAGGIANTFRYWGRWHTFGTLWAAILVGAGFGLTANWSKDGFLTGVAVGGIALPAYDLVTSKIRARRSQPPARTESASSNSPEHDSEV